jgi:Fe-S-cluster formation regulator IscX/YfhJ
MKILQVRAELFRADRRTDRQTDMTKLIVAFRNFAKSPKIDQSRVLEKVVNIYQNALLYIPQDDNFRNY